MCTRIAPRGIMGPTFILTDFPRGKHSLVMMTFFCISSGWRHTQSMTGYSTKNTIRASKAVDGTVFLFGGRDITVDRYGVLTRYADTNYLRFDVLEGGSRCYLASTSTHPINFGHWQTVVARWRAVDNTLELTVSSTNHLDRIFHGSS